MMYPEQLLIPMRQELTRHGVEELKTVADVDAKLADQKGTALVVVNSVWLCRPQRAASGGHGAAARRQARRIDHGVCGPGS